MLETNTGDANGGMRLPRVRLGIEGGRSAQAHASENSAGGRERAA